MSDKAAKVVIRLSDIPKLDESMRIAPRMSPSETLDSIMRDLGEFLNGLLLVTEGGAKRNSLNFSLMQETRGFLGLFADFSGILKTMYEKSSKSCQLARLFFQIQLPRISFSLLAAQ